MLSMITEGDETSGRPETLSTRYMDKPLISRRLNHHDRLIYIKHDEGTIEILQCVGHYKD